MLILTIKMIDLKLIINFWIISSFEFILELFITTLIIH